MPAIPPDQPDLSYIAGDLRPLAVPIGVIQRDPRNARAHNETNLISIMASLERFGQRKPVVVNHRTGQLEAGHGTLAAAVRLKWSHLAVVWVDDEAGEARDYGLADNRTAELADWDQAILDGLLLETRAEDEEFFNALLLGELLRKQGETGGAAEAEPEETWWVIGTASDAAAEVEAIVAKAKMLEGVRVEQRAGKRPAWK